MVICRAATTLPALCFMLFVLAAPVGASERETCERGIQRAGYTPEEPYGYNEAGFFTRANHLFGVFTCEVNVDGTIHRILRGKTVIAEDGLYGINRSLK